MVLAFFVIIIRRKYDQSQDFEKDGPKSFEQGDHSEVELLFFLIVFYPSKLIIHILKRH